MGQGSFLISATVRLALLCYAACVTLQLMNCHGARWRFVLRGLWTTGALLFVAHVLAAFHFAHHWNHQAAIQSTAEQTKELIGWAFGEGLYFSYLFVLLWLADVVWYWVSPVSYESRSLRVKLLLHGYLFFIAFNGAVVFESGVTRPVGVLLSTLFAILSLRWIRGERRRTMKRDHV
ncbi:MAG: hypothetical protein WCK86_21930 [Planctomycetia bacterium]